MKATALVLAGRRNAALDPLAAEAGVDDKCLVPVAGRPMILHVLDALAAAPEISQIIVSLNEPGLLDDYAEVRRLKLLVTVDRKSVVSGKSVSVRVDLGGRRIIKKKKNENMKVTEHEQKNKTHKT